MFRLRVCLLLAAMSVTVCAFAAEPNVAAWPQVKNVEAQPLISQAKRISQALDNIGQPLPAATRAALDALQEKAGNEAIAAEVQKLLDPACLATAVIDETGVIAAIPAVGKPELIEQGWRTFLVKVVNGPGATGKLRVESPNARPIPKSSAQDVPNLWMGLQVYTGQPLLANLSGLGLEYTLVQIFSVDTGAKTGELGFSVEGGKGLKPGKAGSIVREWNFKTDAAGWKADHDCKLIAADGNLKVTITGRDPYITTNVEAKKAPLVLRFNAKFPKAGTGQVFWWTKNRLQPDERDQAQFAIQEGAADYEVRFKSDDELVGLRIDPGDAAGEATFAGITLAYEAEAAKQVQMTIQFEAKPSIPVTFRVTDSDGTPTMGAFLIRDQEGRVYPAQSKRLAPDFFFQSQVYRATGETVHLPAGKYTIVCSHGPESIPERQDLVVDDQPLDVLYKVTRWVNPATRGWWSGDHHIHAAGCAHYENPTQGVHPPDMLRHILGEDLKVGCCLTWGPCFDYQKQFFTGRPDNVSQYPYLLRYDVEVSGFGSHQSGHLNLLKLKDQIPPGGESKNHWPTLGMNTLRWAKKQGAVCGPAHSGSGLTRFVGRVAGAKDGPNGLPHFQIPAYDGIGANEFIVQAALTVPGPDGNDVPAVDFISAMDTDRVAEWTMWYHVLNCGYRVRVSGETDFPCISGERVGMGRVYVKVDGRLDFDRWVDGLAAGRSYVSDGTTHLMDFAAAADGKNYELGVNGSEIKLDKPGKVTFSVQASALHDKKESIPIELIVNGLPVATQKLLCDGQLRELKFEADITAGSWVAIRTFPSAHTNPFFVLVGDKPIRANRNSAEWCLQGIDQCWMSKRETYRKEELPQAEADYEQARKNYRKILEESK